ncbi:hypothetical protein N9140_00240 [bacterium]|nr:hypothetical protein [bacterium]
MGVVEVEAAAAERKYHDKEEFVTGHNGTTPYEIFLMCCVIPIGLQLYYKLYNYHAFFFQHQQGQGQSKGASNNKGTMIKKWSSVIIIEFCTLLLPMLLVQTSLLSYMIGPTILVVGMLSLSYMIPTVNKPTQYYNTESFGPSASKSSSTAAYRPAYLSIHRASVYILTTIAILAVDFPLFPRRFCKTEVSGYGFMDVGASSFIIIAGWTSALSSSSAHDESSQHATKGSSKTLHAKRSSNNNTMRAIKKCLPLFTIGFIRLVTNKGLEYQEHVSEYGVHWNFFFTLCCVEGFMVLWKGVKRQLILLGSIITDNSSNIHGLYYLDGILALLTIVPYQMFLSYYGGQEFIEDGERRCNYDEGNAGNISYAKQFLPTILCNAYAANREGILGVVGYVSLRLLSEDVARICLLVPIQRQQHSSSDEQHKNNNHKHQPMMRQHTQRRLFIVSIVLWMSHLYLTVGLRIPTSRRSTNASFILWSLAHNVSLLCMIHHVMMMNAPKTTTEETGDGCKQQQQHLHRPYILLEAINRYGLAVFLSSNVLTGLVNLTVDTLHSSDGKAMLVMMIYLGLVCGFALLLDGLFDKTKTKE